MTDRLDAGPPTPPRRPDRLAELTWSSLPCDAAPVLVVPVGSCEQHGPHLPLATDTIIAEALASRLVDARRDAVLGPALTVTASGEHQGFPGTLSIGVAVMEAVVVELVRSADWASAVVLVNGHGGNRAAVDGAVRQLRAEDRPARAWWPVVPGGDAHAGHTETSMMLALRPDLVGDLRHAAGPTPPLADLVEHGVRALSPSGVLGDAGGASADHGAHLLDTLTADLVRRCDEWLGTSP